METKRNVFIYSHNVSNSPNSCLIRLQYINLRSLVDSVAELSLINQRIYDSLKYRTPIKRRNIALQSATGTGLDVKGEVRLDFKIAGIKISHDFIVVSDLNRSIILGRDFVVKNGVTLCFDLGKMKIQNAYVPLENHAHIDSIIRLNKTVKLKPQTIYLVDGRMKQNPYLDNQKATSL